MGDRDRPKSFVQPNATTALDKADATVDSLVREVARISTPETRDAGLGLPVGSSLGQGRLHVLRHLGTGGMGAVYEVFDDERRSRVALKLLRTHAAVDVYRLKNEFRVAAGLTHPNIVQLHELFADGQRWFFTMELVDGIPFTDWVRPDGRLDEARLRAATSQVIGAIGAIHAAGKLHRDLKPSNILVTADGRVIVLDFGLTVTDRQGGVGQTVTEHQVVGTPAYMAPEQAAGARATSASDVYALGTMLFESLTGELPFRGHIGEVLLAKQVRDAPPARTADATEISADLDALCAEMLAREPRERPDLASLHDRLAGAKPVRCVVRTSTPKLDPSLHGRARELELLNDAFARTLQGQAVLVTVTGESGIGKSSLCEAFVQTLARERSAVALQGRCFEQETVPFNAFDSLMDALTRYMRGLDDTAAAALLPRDAFALVQLFPVLGRICVMSQAPRRALPDGLRTQHAALAAFTELLTRLRDRAPVIVLLDDVHWVDQDSVTLLRQLLSHRGAPPILLVLSSRAATVGAAGRQSGILDVARANPVWEVRTMALGPLEERDMTSLVDALLTHLSVKRTELTAQVVREAHGSPFLARELCRTAPTESALRTCAELSVTSLLSERVAALSEAARRLLEVAAFVGRPLSAHVALGAADATHDELDRLRQVHLLRRAPNDALDSRPRVECYHDRIRETLRAMLDPVRCRELAERVSIALGESTDDDDPELLSRMLEEAGERDLAARHAERAATRAETALAFDRAAALFRRALQLGTYSQARMCELNERLANALAMAGYGAESAQAFLTAAAASVGLEALNLRRRAAEELLGTGHVIDGTLLLKAVCREAGVPLPMSVPHALASLAWTTARLRASGLRVTRTTQPTPQELHRLQLALTVVTGFLGYLPIEAASAAARYLKMALEIGDTHHLVWALGHSAGIHALHAPYSKWTCALLERTKQVAEKTNLPDLVGFANLIEGGWLYQTAGFASSRERLEKALALFRKTSVSSLHVDLAHLYDVLSSFACGEFRYLAEVVPARLDEAYRRNRVWAALMMSGPWGTLPAFLASDRPNDMRIYLAEANAALTKSALSGWPYFMLAMSNAAVLMYEGEPAQGLSVIEHYRKTCTGDFLTRNGSVSFGLALIRGEFALAAHAMTSPSADPRRSSFLALARRSAAEARSLRRSDNWPGRTLLLEAGIAYHEGDSERAIPALRDAVRQLDQHGAQMFAAAARIRLGELIGGDTGKDLISASRAFMHAQRVKNEAAMMLTLVWPS